MSFPNFEKHLGKYIRPQVKTNDVLKKMATFLEKKKIVLYSPIGFDINNFMENFTITNDTSFSAGDVVNVSLGIVKDGNFLRTTFCVPLSIYGNHLYTKAQSIFLKSLEGIKAGSRYSDITRSIEAAVKNESLGVIRNIYGFNMKESKYIIPPSLQQDIKDIDYYRNISTELKVGDILYVVIPLSSDTITQDAQVYPHGVIFTVNPEVKITDFKLSATRKIYEELVKTYKGKFFTILSLKKIVEKYSVGKSSEAYLKDLFNRRSLMEIQSLYIPIEEKKTPTHCIKYGRTIRITENGYDLLI